MDECLGFKGTWRDGWVMYDGTIVVLHAKPGMNGDAYFTCKSNYGLNVQLCGVILGSIVLIFGYIGNLPSNLHIVDYSHGMTGSAHDSWAFEHTTTSKFPNWFFQGEEFAWADSVYGVSPQAIPVHKKPATSLPENTACHYAVTNLHVHSEHCMGAL
ncbi:hypothetical protein PAXRUDRAFT_158828 [Paxillus rubicundulus Ve08.2h10]|uniref:DDE Tnp4 domain-containing protein n=1 Tax=Paxillus rubicundulus Ve08.2h10 TaxID=930991 RepID=A0A0D0DGK1_9AGAM|nr:hypothetical protein PAXRUDRAFT_158828 [Paxillus rubicundulus Ve08.2h10]